VAEQPTTGFVPVPPDELDDEEFYRRYGPAEPLLPSGVARLFAGAPFPWWVVGGWSVDDETSPRRHHEDIEVAVLRRDFRAVVGWLADWHVWDIHAGTLRLLLGEWDMPDDHEQAWVRRDAHSPWVMDLLLTPADGDDWLYKKDQRVRRPLADVVRMGADGVPRQLPEIALLFKSRFLRAKDVADFEAVLPTLDMAARRWLQGVLLLVAPGHPWTARL
jgi:hypothetical protein